MSCDVMRCFIKYMVCDRCKAIVIDALKKTGIRYYKVSLGELLIAKRMTCLQFEQLNTLLKKSGLELLDSQKNSQAEKLLNTIDDLVNFPEKDWKKSNPDYLSKKFNQNYGLLNTMFSEIECISIEKYIAEHKIIKIKEMLSYNELNLTEIAKIMHYKSVAQLSGHFKSMTGLTPVYFKQIRSRLNYFPCCN